MIGQILISQNLVSTICKESNPWSPLRWAILPSRPCPYWVSVELVGKANLGNNPSGVFSPPSIRHKHHMILLAQRFCLSLYHGVSTNMEARDRDGRQDDILTLAFEDSLETINSVHGPQFIFFDDMRSSRWHPPRKHIVADQIQILSDSIQISLPTCTRYYAYQLSWSGVSTHLTLLSWCNCWVPLDKPEAAT